MSELRVDPSTGQLAQLLPTQADHETGDAVPGTERWIVLYFQPGSGISVRMLDDAEVEAWTPVRTTTG